MIYLIKNSVYFDERSGRLFNRSKEVFLGENERICLRLLVESEGAIVHGSVLILHIWKSEKSGASGNSLRQSIHIIRKALMTLSLDQSVIITQPRIGYAISEVKPVHDVINEYAHVHCCSFSHWQELYNVAVNFSFLCLCLLFFLEVLTLACSILNVLTIWGVTSIYGCLLGLIVVPTY